MSAQAQRPAMKNNSEQRKLERAAGRAQIGASLSTVLGLVFGVCAFTPFVPMIKDSLPDFSDSGESGCSKTEVAAPPSVAVSVGEDLGNILKLSVPLALLTSVFMANADRLTYRSKKISEDLKNLQNPSSHQPQ